MFAAPALAADSVYQPLNEADCPRVADYEAGGASFCHGPDGTPFLISEGDLRMSVTYGGVGPNSQPPFQTFQSFNSLGELIEWRIEGNRPFATILRWHIESGDGGSPGQVLVVSKVGEGETPGCVVAYVDARANSNANELARDAADRMAPGVDCASHVPAYYGERGPTAGEPSF